ncbi:MAG: aminomethyl-transferring glycine dehydrogenase [Actinobacteria bacterium]|nr:aminomethyl-transferring glycine dehydrogenase [Actinomycetota bacterium]
MRKSLDELTANDEFISRHIGVDDFARETMLRSIGATDLEDLIKRTVPASIRRDQLLSLGEPMRETDVLIQLREIANKNIVRTSLIGMGYYNTITPPVIARNVLENPAWYTSYTPYQPEISQGRLEALLNFQTMITEITGFEIANASLLDEATAAAEAMTIALRSSKSKSSVFAVDIDTHPQIISVLRTRALPIGLTINVVSLNEMLSTTCFGALISWPGSTGSIASAEQLKNISNAVHSQAGLTIAVCDLLACMLLTPPATLGLDIAVGSAQRFGVPMGGGGPHAAFLATSESHARALPGRLVGVSTDTGGRPALRLALQTREQHIRREKATSNICTAQALLANIASFYAVWHGREGLERIAERVHRLTSICVAGLRKSNIEVSNSTWFDTIVVRVKSSYEIHQRAQSHNILLRNIDDTSVGISFDETSNLDLIKTLFNVFEIDENVLELDQSCVLGITQAMRRSDDFLTQATFSKYRTEHEMLRYLRRLADKDLALDRTMIPLGSCTMKLNATTEMIPVTWPEFANIHPFAPATDIAGYTQLVDELSAMLIEITGYDAISLQPNAGSQGELAGLLAIRAYHRNRGEEQRVICLIPSSAHGTNAASAVMAGMTVVVVACDDRGNVDLVDLKTKCELAGNKLAALMITYPSTHGVFEQKVTDICELVHSFGGQVYVDGANLNALVGVAQPGHFGADVSHLNLHKTFCIPHGGGGPGVGPVGVKKHLAEFLPSHPLSTHDEKRVGAVAAAPNGSASILPISWVYIKLMGAIGLRSATMHAILSANYIANRLDAFFPVLYRGEGGFVAHECILDIREITKMTGVTNDDIAKRLMDFGFHAPTMSFPVSGTFMVEPTESETIAEIDRFCNAMIAIHNEIQQIASGTISHDESPLHHAPHTVEDLCAPWTRKYSQQQAAYPIAAMHGRGYFVPVSRIDAAFGDRNLVCSCEPLESYAISLQ